MIFLVVFQPLLNFLLKHKSQGCKLGNHHVVTLPFADDFEVISNHQTKHQKLVLEVQAKAESMGLEFKASKCRSLSIKSGIVTSVPFSLKAKDGSLVALKTMEDDPHKFLGSSITHRNTDADHMAFLKGRLQEKLENLDTKCQVRGEYKVATYSRYLLPSLRFHFSVHNIHQTHLDELDHLASTFLKRWLDIPSRGVTILGLFHPLLFGIKLPSQMYLEGHMSNFLNIKVASKDPVVK